MLAFGTELVGRGVQETLYHDPDAPTQPEQQQWEFQRLLEIYGRLKPRTVLEIGSAKGGVLYQLMKCAEPGGLFVSVDIVSLSVDIASCSGGWQEWAARFGHTLHIVVGDSAAPDIISKVKSLVPKVDFLMIDGDHLYEPVKRDFLNYGPLVRLGGVIILHDIVTAWPGCEVSKLWAELRHYGYITQDLVVSPVQGQCGTGVLYVGEYINALGGVNHG